MKPVCVPCGLFFKAKKTGAYVEEGMPRNEARTEWDPYKVWVGDMYECRGCGAQMVIGFGQGPVAEHFQKDYQERVARMNLVCRVNDC
jgi:hypothetical protein